VIRRQQRHVAFQPFAVSFDEHFPPMFQQHPDEDESDLSSFMARAPGARMPLDELSTDSDSDLNTNPPTSPSSFGPPQEWQSAQVYDLNGNFAHGRVHTQPPEASFADIRRLLGMTHHAVANIFDIQPSPKDLQAANIAPFLLLAHTDMRFGDTRRAVLIDVELHGPTFESVVEIDRYTTLLPTPIHRSLILRIAGVLQYCTTMRNRCLLWHRGALIIARSRANLDLHIMVITYALRCRPLSHPAFPLTMQYGQANMDSIEDKLFNAIDANLIMMNFSQMSKQRNNPLTKPHYCK